MLEEALGPEAGDEEERGSRVGGPERVRVLMEQYDILSAELRVLRASYDRVLGLGMVALAALYVYGVKENLSPIVVGHPVLLFALLLFMMDMMNLTMALGAHKQALEHLVNAELGGNLVAWEKIAHTHVHRGPYAMLGVMVVYVSFIAFSVYTSLTTAYATAPAPLFWGFAAFLGVLAVWTVVSWMISWDRYDKVLQESLRHASGPLAPWPEGTAPREVPVKTPPTR